MSENINAPAVDCQADSVWPIGKKAAIYSCIVLCLLAMFDMLDRQILAAVFPFLKAEWQLTDTQLGMLVSVVAITVSVLVIPSAYLIDRWSRTKMISLMGVIWSGALVACALAGNYAHMFAARAVVGAGQAGYNPAAHALIAAQFPTRRRSLAIAVYHFFLAIGAPLGLMTGAFIATHWGWRHALGIVAVPTLILAIMAWFIKDYKSVDVVDEGQAGSDKPGRKVPFGILLVRVLGTPSLVCVILAAVAMQMFTGGLMNWLPSYYIREAGFTVTHASTLSSIVMVVGIFSTLLVGPVIDWIHKYLKNGTAVVMALCTGMTALFSMLAFGLMTPGSTLQVVVLVLASFMGATFMTGGPLVLIELTHPGARATAFSMLIFCQNILGFAVGPVIVGFISDRFDLGTALFIQGAITMVACLAYVICTFTYKYDAAKVACVNLEFDN